MNWFRCISGVMLGVLASNVVDRVFELWSSQTKDYTIGISWFSAKYAAFRRKSKHWFARNQNNVSDWGDKSICGLLFHYKIKMCWSSTKRTSPYLIETLLSPLYGYTIA